MIELSDILVYDQMCHDRGYKPETARQRSMCRAITSNWSTRDTSLIVLWDLQRQHVVMGTPDVGPMPEDDQYMVKYRYITRRFITHL